jgi:limonene-1,2-epoxide hydrolase
MMSDQTSLVERFLGLIDKAVSDKSAEAAHELIGLLDDDILYQNKPQRPVRGKDEFFQWFAEFAACEQMTCRIRHIAQDDASVLTERTDSWTLGGVRVEMDLMGVFDIRDGRIVRWVDYITDREAWEASGQMAAGFFERWRDTTFIVR